MGVSRATAAENRNRIIEVASRLFREKGFDGIGINDLMKAAGLTHGGFYANFSSKENLATESTTLALNNGLRLLSDAASKADRAPFAAVVRFYLSERHRDHVGTGCALAALGSDVARYGQSLRTVFAAGLAAHVDLLEQLIEQDSEDKRKMAVVAMATMIGALTMARAVGNNNASKAILKNARERLIATCTGSGEPGSSN